MKLHCMNCGKETELNKIYNDDLGYHRVCPECGASHDIDNETAFEFEKQLYEPMVRAALTDGWSPRAVRSSIYELFQEYCISEDTEDYLYGLADPLFGITAQTIRQMTIKIVTRLPLIGGTITLARI